MAYLGKIDLAKEAPNHPFAHAWISIGGVSVTQPTRPKLPIGRHGVTVSVSWGYELHSVKVGATRWRHIRQGKEVCVRSTGWYEGKSFPCRWYFNSHPEHDLVVCYGDDGGVGYNGPIQGCQIDPRQRQSRQVLTRES